MLPSKLQVGEKYVTRLGKVIEVLFIGDVSVFYRDKTGHEPSESIVYARNHWTNYYRPAPPTPKVKWAQYLVMYKDTERPKPTIHYYKDDNDLKENLLNYHCLIWHERLDFTEREREQ